MEDYAHKVNLRSKFIATATEDTLMSLIKLTIIFPLIINSLLKPRTWSLHVPSKDSSILIFSTMSSIYSLGAAFTITYFSKLSKTDADRTFKNRLIYTLSTMFPVSGKLCSYQLFVFGMVLKFDMPGECILVLSVIGMDLTSSLTK